MVVIRSGASQVFEAHGSRFLSYARPAVGSAELCAWRLEVPAGIVGTPHRPSGEEVLLVLTGSFHVAVDDVHSALEPGDVLVVPAGCWFQVDAGPAGGSAWVTTRTGLQATTGDGQVLAPPWAQ